MEEVGEKETKINYEVMEYYLHGKVLYVSAPSYRLSQEALWPAQIQDVKCAIRYIRTNADKLKIDPNRIGISGNSAGGHLSLMAGLSRYDPNF